MVRSKTQIYRYTEVDIYNIQLVKKRNQYTNKRKCYSNI